MTNKEESPDVVVIGAGISGLVAAHELLRADKTIKITILEAMNRVGGRTFSTEMKGKNHSREKFDLGAQWIGPTQTRVLQLIDSLELKTYKQFLDGDKMAQIGVSKPRKYTSDQFIFSIRHFSIFEILDSTLTVLKMKWLVKFSNLKNYFSWKKATSLDNMTVAKWATENSWTRATQDVLDIAIRCVYGTEANRISMMFHVITAKTTGGEDRIFDADECIALKVSGGAYQISEKLSEKIGTDKIRLGHVVKRIDVNENNGTAVLHVEDHKGRKETITTRHVIAAIPPNQCARIKITPDVPELKRRLFNSATQGNLIKFIITYEKAFWRENGMSGEIISTGRTEKPGEVLPIICTYDATTPSGVPALVGFMNEEYADKVFSERCNLVVTDLVRFLGDDAFKQFLDYKDKIWAHEEYVGGCPNAMFPPGQMDAYQTIREPFHNVHFASTETATVWMGYMEGAIQSGQRTAHEVLHCMEKHSLVSYEYLKDTIYDHDYETPCPPSNVYDESRSPWWRRLFFASALVFGVYAYSRKYQLSVVAKTMKPIENKLVKYFFEIDWPV